MFDITSLEVIPKTIDFLIHEKTLSSFSLLRLRQGDLMMPSILAGVFINKLNSSEDPDPL